MFMCFFFPWLRASLIWLWVSGPWILWHPISRLPDFFARRPSEAVSTLSGPRLRLRVQSRRRGLRSKRPPKGPRTPKTLKYRINFALCRRNLWIFPPHVHVNLAVDFAVNSVMDFSWSFEPSKTGYNGPEKIAPKSAQEFALKFAPPRGKIRTGFALQDAGAKNIG